MYKNHIIPFALIVTVLVASCHSENKPDEYRLKKRSTEFNNYMLRGKYEKAWAMLLKEVKSQTNIPLDDWVYTNKQAENISRIVSIKIESIKISKVDSHFIGIVRLKAQNEIVKADKSKLIKDVTYDDFWSFENGDWYRFAGD